MAVLRTQDLMATLRLKSTWFRDGAKRAPEQLASAAAAVVWRTANHRIAHMRSVGFGIDAGEPYVRVLVELLCFLIAIADRVAFAHDPGPWRTAFTSALAARVGELFEDCFAELIGGAAAGYKRRFIDRLNERTAQYAHYRYGASGAEFGFYRHFGDALADALPAQYDRRWGADQAMSVDGPAAAEAVASAMAGLLGRAPKTRRSRTVEA
jgi:hypothetical protein